jgi:hypothetical protein
MSNTVVFRGEVYAWDGAKATGTNLYESAPMRTSGSGTFEEITFEPGGIKLVPGQQYILFATVSKDYAPSGGTRGIWGMATTNPYNGGAFQYDNNAGDINDLLTNPWTPLRTAKRRMTSHSGLFSLRSRHFRLSRTPKPTAGMAATRTSASRTKASASRP